MLVAILFAYAFMNFGLFMEATDGGSPQRSQNGYVLNSHGTVIRALTKVEYDAYRVNELRGFSGHWLLFYALPAFFFLFTSGPSRERESVGRRGR